MTPTSPQGKSAMRLGNKIARGAAIFRKGITNTVSFGSETIRRSAEKIKRSNKVIKSENAKQEKIKDQVKEGDQRRERAEKIASNKLGTPVQRLVKRVLAKPIEGFWKLLALWALKNLPFLIKEVRKFVKKIRIFAAMVKRSFLTLGDIVKKMFGVARAFMQNVIELDWQDSKGRLQAAQDDLDYEFEELKTGFGEMKNVWGREEEDLDRILENLEQENNIQDVINNAMPQQAAFGPNSQSSAAAMNAPISGGTPLNPNEAQAFKYVYDLAKKHGAKFPEVAAAQAMQETGWLKNPNSVYFQSNKTNAFGQSVELSNKASWPGRGITGYVSTKTANGGVRHWAVYKDFEAGVKDHVNLWHKSRRGMRNYNDFDTAEAGINWIIDKYSPDKDPDNIKRGFKSSKYAENSLKFIADAGINPKGGAGQSLNSTYSNATIPQEPAPAATAKVPANAQGVGKSTDAAGFALGSNTLYAKDFDTMDENAPSPIIKTSGRGRRWGRHHGGIDYAPPNGARGWYCALQTNGTVTYVGNAGNFGKLVIINIGNVELLFGHLAQYSPGIRVGATYTAGQPIGEIGNTGGSTGTHLHYEARPVGGGRGTDIDVQPYVKLLVFGKLKKVGNSNNTKISSSPKTEATQQIASRRTTGNRTTTTILKQDHYIGVPQVA